MGGKGEKGMMTPLEGKAKTIKRIWERAKGGRGNLVYKLGHLM